MAGHSPVTIVAFASAVALILLGGLLLQLKPRSRPQVFFGLFAVTWGMQLGLLNLGRIIWEPSEAAYNTVFLLGHAVMPVATLFLVHFAMVVRRRPYGRVVTLCTGLIAVAAALVISLRPDLVVVSQSPHLVWGILAFPLFQAPQRIAFFLALIVMYFEYRRAKPGSPRRRVRGILVALALLVSYRDAGFLAYEITTPGRITEFASGAVQAVGGLTAYVTIALLLVSTLTMIGIVLHLFLRPPPPEGIDGMLLFAFLFPMGVVVLELLLNMIGIPFETRGFWELLAVGVIVYTLSHYHLFDLELRVKRFAVPIIAGVVVLFGIPTLLTLALGEFGFQPFVFAVVPQVVGIAGIVLFQERVKSALFPGVDDTPDYMHQRKLEIYRVAMEDTVQRGGTPEDAHLKELRLRHGITSQEHSIVAWMVSSEHRRPGASEARFEIGNTVLERYRLTRPLGKGSYGRTFLAYDNQTRREVVLKTVDTQTFDGAAARLLLREARLAASLDHPYVIDILDVAELPDRSVVVMEYADNGNLEDHLRRHGAFELPEGIRFLRELLMALEAVHERRIVHRNMKPKNILLEADGSVRLSDFGAAQSATKKSAEKTELAKKTLQDVLYQSPEQLEDKEATPRSDLFVAGILFHEVLTRRHPYPVQGKDDHRIRTAILSGKLELHTKSKDDWVDEFLRKALSTDPQQRYGDAKAMRMELERLAGVPDTGSLDTRGALEGPAGARTT